MEWKNATGDKNKCKREHTQKLRNISYFSQLNRKKTVWLYEVCGSNITRQLAEKINA